MSYGNSGIGVGAPAVGGGSGYGAGPSADFGPNGYGQSPTYGGLFAIGNGLIGGYLQGRSLAYQRQIAMAQQQRNNLLADSLIGHRETLDANGTTNANNGTLRATTGADKASFGFVNSSLNALRQMKAAGSTDEQIQAAGQGFLGAVANDPDASAAIRQELGMSPAVHTGPSAPSTAVVPPGLPSASATLPTASAAANTPAANAPVTDSGAMPDMGTVGAAAGGQMATALPNPATAWLPPAVVPAGIASAAAAGAAVPAVATALPNLAAAPASVVTTPAPVNPWIGAGSAPQKPITPEQLIRNGQTDTRIGIAQGGLADRDKLAASTIGHTATADELAWDKDAQTRINALANGTTAQQAHEIVADQQYAQAKGYSPAFLPPIPGMPDGNGGYNPKIALTPQQGSQNAVAGLANVTAGEKPALTASTLANTASEISTRAAQTALAQQAQKDKEANDAFTQTMQGKNYDLNAARLHLAQSAQAVQQGESREKVANQIDSNYTTAASQLQKWQATKNPNSQYLDGNGQPTAVPTATVNPKWQQFEQGRSQSVLDVQNYMQQNRDTRNTILPAPQGSGPIGIGSAVSPLGIFGDDPSGTSLIPGLTGALTSPMPPASANLPTAPAPSPYYKGNNPNPALAPSAPRTATKRPGPVPSSPNGVGVRFRPVAPPAAKTPQVKPTSQSYLNAGF